MKGHWLAWLVLGAAVGGWVGYELGRPSWLRAAQQLASGQRAPGVVEAIAVAASGVGDYVSGWRQRATEEFALQCAADLQVAQAGERELRSVVSDWQDRNAELRQAAQASAGRHSVEVVDAISNRAALYAGPCRDWGMQPICPDVQRLRERERAQLSTADGADRGGASEPPDPTRVDRNAASAQQLPATVDGRSGEVRDGAGGAVSPLQPGSQQLAGADR